jgi:hypothetical protein
LSSLSISSTNEIIAHNRIPHSFTLVAEIKQCLKLMIKVGRWLINEERAKSTEVVV